MAGSNPYKEMELISITTWILKNLTKKKKKEKDKKHHFLMGNLKIHILKWDSNLDPSNSYSTM